MYKITFIKFHKVPQKQKKSIRKNKINKRKLQINWTVVIFTFYTWESVKCTIRATFTGGHVICVKFHIYFGCVMLGEST